MPAPLIVSVTTYPPRFKTVALSLRSLLRQTVRPDHMVLWLPSGTAASLPRHVADLQRNGLEIRETQDVGSYTKIIPALDAFPDAFIATADDDAYYWPSWLGEMVDEVRGKSKVIACHRARQIASDDDGSFRPYLEWASGADGGSAPHRLFPTGVGGVLYPPGALAHNENDRRAALTLCPSNDDIWLFWIGRRNGARCKLVGRGREPLLWPGSQKVALWHRNKNGANDEQTRQMAARYGYPS